MLVIIDNQSKFIKKFKKDYLIHQKFEYRFFDHNKPIILPDNAEVQGIILSGGKGNPFKPLNLTANFVALMNWNVPIIGFCLGHEIIATAYNSSISKMISYQDKKQEVIISKPDDPIFAGIDKRSLSLREKHSYEVSHLADCFTTLAYSKVCRHEIIKLKDRPVYGFQSHPEASGDDGMLLVNNFLKMCNLI